jgi:hypothetical protein
VVSSDMKAQISIRMTKIASRDPPPHYPIQDIPLMKQPLLGLIHTVDSAIKERWNTNPRIKIFLVDSHSDFERLQDDSDCLFQVNEEFASVFLRTRRLLHDSPPSSHTSTTQPQHPRSHRKLATRPNRSPNAQSTMPQCMQYPQTAAC